MEESETKGRISQETDKACVSVERIGSTLLSSFVKKGKEVSNKRNSKQNKRKAEEELCSKSRTKKYSRGWVRCEEMEEEKVKKTRKRKSKRQQKDNKVEVDDSLRLQRRTRYLLIKMKMQQNLIDAYATEGWKGQSREKIRPDKELERARKEILNCKLGLRDAIRQLDLLSSVGSMEEKVIASDGSIHHDHIFCAECNSREAFPDNDIILCDGTCNRAFHQKCLDPPLETESIPPGDQGWFCKFCDCKIEIIDTMNAQIGTHFPVDSNWQDIFNEEASLPIGSEATVNNEADWPSDDSKDDDYDPEMRENGGGNSSNVSGDGGGDNDEESISTSLSLSSDGVALSTGSWEGHRLSNMVEQCETSNEETVCGPRQRRTVDYTQLYYEMFGKDAVLQEQGSEDEDWGPNDRRKRKRESDAGSTLVTMCESSKKDQDVVETLEQSERDSVSVENKGGRRRMFRLPRNAVEKLRQVFAETELPSKAVRDRLAKELSLDPEKVNKWFKNTRYMALRNRKTESVKQPGDSKTVSGGDSGPEAVMENNTETNEVQDTLDDTVPPGFDATNQNILSPCNNNQEEFQQENVSFPSPTDESQQYLEQNDSSFVLVPHEKQSSEISLKTAVEENETESKMMKEPHEELSSEMSLKTAAEEKETESKMIEEPHEELSREMSLKTAVEEKETESKMMEEPHDELNSEMSLSTAVEEKETGSKMTEESHEELSNEMSLEEKETGRKMTEEEELEAVMEMLCRTENKLLDVTQRLDRFKTPKGRKKLGNSSSPLLEEDSVVYVPIAEIKEKR
ncbi:pathogenesis related homeodomain protein (PRHA) [Arabidopsis thaliana]|uniref:Pathogenesis-related homeodomain protein n=2 Tax=Arabidopsis thaliana TaxID=3702 RepID=PRH_ARATH|nr:pathogenesis related homeodomain protein A [Arabidopsis thaliana]P48785.1 RecName: Full=Pathogenesis-related homeodomain protein; Short=PRHA [Arabidopsis thaliana]AAA32843.1 homeodomain protein [Arabidopsis thaliana]AAC49836.1 PRHA [Arabidopsis thaliana]AEE85698.1 pathogenesis related homeodomain protein A [Arabidopsis thaliana]CAB43669.1 pathogenesis related homeodomain protein (PRHA) [Arabidopsis thaliana]CAB79752.1 pathogenesis related homeodomain protein (PRHA) [Arabidopsis thaliana]|eukprot:NP_194723.1 pathogenesis related homeodomain protein A [Arabidopsis thaliana]